MTRETKIGLLVGLAFIIVIGILLSDYNRNEIQNAPLPQVADNLRSSTATLRNNGSTQSEIVLPPPAPVPTRTVMTQQDLHHETPADPNIVGPMALAARTDDRTPIRSSAPIIIGGPLVDATPEAPVHAAPDVTGPTGIQDTVPYNPHAPIAPVPGVSPAPTPAPTHHDNPPAAPTVNGAKQYVAVSGDTVNKLAGRFLGGNTKANRDAILAINPSLKANPNNVIVGRTYMIPPVGGKPVVASAVTPASAAPVHAAPVTAAPVTPAPVVPAPTNSAHVIYTVKDRDSLWKIAAEQLGSDDVAAKVEQIKELNVAVLKGTDDVQPKMQLKLPPRTVASTN